MKIKASAIKPGMVIGIDRGDNFGDICLVTAKKGFVEVEYTHLDYQDAYIGKMVGTLKGKVKVKLIKGKKRVAVIKSIKKDLFDRLKDVENDINLIWLIQAMDKGI